MADLIRRIDASPARPHIELTATGLQITGDIEYDDWLDVMDSLQHIGAAWKWAMGDGLSYGEQQWGERYAQAVAVAEEIGVHPDTVRRAQQVSERIEFGRRRPNLSWSHHNEVAYLDPEFQDAVLLLAEIGSWSVSATRKVKNEILRRIEAGEPIGLTDDPEAPFVRRRTNPDSDAPEPGDTDDRGGEDDSSGPDQDDLLAIVEEQQAQIRDLTERLEALAEDDDARMLDQYVQRSRHLAGRVETLTRQAKEAQRSAQYYARTIGEVRSALGVERNRDIIPALQELSGARR